MANQRSLKTLERGRMKRWLKKRLKFGFFRPIRITELDGEYGYLKPVILEMAKLPINEMKSPSPD